MTLTVTAAPNVPLIGFGGIVDGANFGKGPLAAGSIASIFGSNLAIGSQTAFTAPLPTTLDNVNVTVNGLLAPIYFVSPDQINIQLPWETSGQSQVSVAIIVNGVTSNTIVLPIAQAGPSVFSINSQGTGQAAALIANTDIVAAPTGSIVGRNARPAMRGEFISVFCDGLGNVSNPPKSGSAALADPLSRTLNSVSVTIGGVASTPTFAGLAPGYVGLYQVNVQVPSKAPTDSSVELLLSVGGIQATLVTIAVQ